MISNGKAEAKESQKDAEQSSKKTPSIKNCQTNIEGHIGEVF
jgi:hypothetical protein